MTTNPTDLKRADAFRKIALRLAPERTGEIDRTIAEQRPQMALLAEAIIFDHDEQSSKVFETLTETCENFAKQHAETRDLK